MNDPRRSPDLGPTPSWASSECARNLSAFLSWLLPRHQALGGVTEIRVIARGERRGVWATYVEPGDEAWVIQALDPEHRGGDHPVVGQANVYFSLNPVRPGLGPLRQFRRAGRTARDADVLAYSLFAIDIDPERRPRHRSASDQEKASARKVAEAIQGWLKEQGVDPLWADSGNGYHLLVPLVPVLGDEVAQAARDGRQLLHWLDQRFSTPQAKVDTSTYNPSRILKLYGTQAVKGAPTPDHPHRWSRVELATILEDIDLFTRLESIFTGASATQIAPPGEGRRSGAKPKGRRRSLSRRSPPSGGETIWREWRRRALAALPLEAPYGELLTGHRSGDTWLECRDPASETGDQNPSAGIADGDGEAERASFHSFRTGETCSVFDFLIRQGKARDFKDACTQIAAWSGVPLPEKASQHGPANPADRTVEQFASRWEAARTDAARLLAIRRAIDGLIELPALERQPRLDAVREISGLAPSIFKETVKEVRQLARRRRRQLTPDEPKSDKTVVDWVENRDTVDELFTALVEALRPADRFFCTEQELVYVEPGVGPKSVTERNIAGLLSTRTELRFLRNTEDGLVFIRYDVLPSDLGRAFVSSPGVRARLPRLRAYTRAPIFDRSWRFVGSPGFHPEAGIFYDGPAVERRECFDSLQAIVRDFHWKTNADLVNFIGTLLTALTMPHWGRGHPFLAINGNKPGVGKTTLARILGIVVEGQVPTSVTFTPDDTEFEKQLATRVEAGDRVIVIDNAKTSKPIQSAVLERCITDAKPNFRRLGSNTAITREENDLLICLTMNLTRMGQDLRRRALPIHLELNANVRSVSYSVDDLIGMVIDRRVEIVGELAGMVLRWLEAGRPPSPDPARHSTSQLWAATMDAILHFNGLEGFLSNFEASEHAFDPRFEIMLEIVQLHHGASPATASEWVERLRDGPLEDRFKDRRGNPKSARSCSTIVGALFTEYLDTHFKVDDRTYELVREYPDGATRSPTYAFREVG